MPEIRICDSSGLALSGTQLGYFRAHSQDLKPGNVLVRAGGEDGAWNAWPRFNNFMQVLLNFISSFRIYRYLDNFRYNSYNISYDLIHNFAGLLQFYSLDDSSDLCVR